MSCLDPFCVFNVLCVVFSVYMFGIEACRTAAAAVTFTNQHLWKVNTKLPKNSLTTVKLSPSTYTRCVTMTCFVILLVISCTRDCKCYPQN